MSGIRACAALLAASLATTAISAAAPADKVFHRGDGTQKRAHAPKVLEQFTTSDGRVVTVYDGYFVRVTDAKRHAQAVRYLSRLSALMMATTRSRDTVPARQAVLDALAVPAWSTPYVGNDVVAVLRPGTMLLSSDIKPSRAQLLAMTTASRSPLAFGYSNDAQLNRVLSQFATREGVHLFAGISARVASMRERAGPATSALPIENSYLFHLTRGHVRDAVAALRALPSVMYAGANLRVSTMNTVSIPLGHGNGAISRALAARAPSTFALPRFRTAVEPGTVPTNYDVTYSGQSFLNAPGTNAIAAYSEIAKQFKELPGAGEIITNVSLGDLDGGGSTADPCEQYVKANGYAPTTIVQGGQRYLNFDSLPLIPTYTADLTGDLDGTGEVCGVDPLLTEVGLDFSVMAALPDQLQRPGEQASGLGDLLGIAPGAEYRLVVPASNQVGAADIAGALLGAATQNPPPNVITASVGYGNDEFGFPTRYLEEDPLVRATIASIVAQGIVVCVASGDGLRTYTNAAAGPSGGTVPLDVVTSGGTNENEDAYSTMPSAVVDTGSITVGGTTLDDVTTNPPYWAVNAKYRDQQAYPAVRWNGSGAYASTFGSRVDIAAPSDNILAIEGFATASILQITGGSSAAAPMVAAAAAVALQVAKATGKPFTNPRDVRKFLVSTGSQIPNVAQADRSINVGPQLNIGHAVETLLRKGNIQVKPDVERIAIAQRFPLGASDFAFTTDTDPVNIDLTGASPVEACETGCTAFQPITIAPDWQALPAGTHFKLTFDGRPIPAPNPWARLYPETIFKAAGLPLYFAQGRRSVAVSYMAYSGTRLIAQASTVLNFLPNAHNLMYMGPPPLVPPVVTGKTIPVQYDLSSVDPSALHAPQVQVSVPDRASPAQPGYHLLYTAPITGTKGTIEIPVDALQGDGIYGIAVDPQVGSNGSGGTTTWAYTRVATAGSVRPDAPLLSLSGGASATNSGAHILDVPYGSPFQVTWDVSNVPKATGAMLEISAPGPTLYGNENPFNNPNGSIRDGNGIDTGSQVYIRLSGVKGTTSVASTRLLSAEQQVVRVIPMAGAIAAGEAGDDSTIVTHGIQTSDGGNILGGFEINPLGTDGLLSSTQDEGAVENASGGSTSVSSSSLQAIDLTTNSTGAVLGASTNTLPFSSATPWFYSLNNFTFDPTSDSAFGTNPLAFTGERTTWLPDVAQYLTAGQVGDDRPLSPPVGQIPATAALLAGSNNVFFYGVGVNQLFAVPATISNSPSNGAQFAWGTGFQFSNIVVSGGLGFAAATKANYPHSAFPGYAMAEGITGCDLNPAQNQQQAYLDILNLSTGSAQIICPFPGSGAWAGIAIVPNASDPPQLVAVPSQLGSTVYLYNFVSNTLFSTVTTNGSAAASVVPFQGASGNGYVAIQNALSGDYATNDNALSSLDVVSPTGLNASIETSNVDSFYNEFFNDSLLQSYAPNWIGFNQKTQTFYVLAPDGNEIQVIPASGF